MKSNDHTIENPRLLKSPEPLTCLGFSTLYLPTICIKEILLPMTCNNIDGKVITFGELIWYLSLRLILSMQVETNVHKYFSLVKIDPYISGDLFKLNEVMAYNRFC